MLGMAAGALGQPVPDEVDAPDEAEAPAEVGSSEAALPDGDAAPLPEDAEAERVLEARFRQLDGLSGVDVSVRAGIATLDGTALSFRDAEQAVEIAGKTAGIVAVQDRIGIETGVEERVRPALGRSPPAVWPEDGDSEFLAVRPCPAVLR